MKLHTPLLLLAMAALGFVAPGCGSSNASEAKLLKFNLQKGKTYTYQMDMDMNFSAEGMTTNTEVDADYDVSVVAEDKGIKTIETTYKRMAMKMSAPGRNIDVDTDRDNPKTAEELRTDPTGVLSNVYEAMVGKKFTMTVDAEGNVLSVSGVNEMMNAISQSIAVDSQMRPMVQQLMAQQLNENNLKKSFEQAFTIFPNRAVKVGDTWEKSTPLPGVTGSVMRTKYTVKDVADKKVVLDATSDVQSGEFRIKQTGTMEIDPATGLVRTANLKQESVGPNKMSTTIQMEGKEQ